MTRTAAQSMLDIHSHRALVEIARDQATSRTLSETTRRYFDDLADGTTDGTDEQRESAFFEAAASMATRYGQSYSRRIALGDLQRLRTAVMTGVSFAERAYTVGSPVGITVKPDGSIDVVVYLGEAGQGVADDVDYDEDTDTYVDNPHRATDAVRIAAAVENGAVTVSYSAGA